MNKIKKFVKNHKKKLILSAIVISGTVLTVIGVKHFKMHTRKKTTTILLDELGIFKDVPIPKCLKEWDVSDLWMDDVRLNAIINRVPVADLGNLGEKFVEADLVQSGDLATVVIGIAPN